ncbi:Roundabout-like 1, partial [Stylophora pistillata]
LTGVQKEDFGKYQCIANNSIGRSQSEVAFLNKDVQKPEIVQGPKNQSASIGSNATFSCTAKGFPRPTIQWIKDNVSYHLQANPRASVTLDGPTNRSQLFITRVEMEDYGNYQCLAKNSVGRSHSGEAVLSKAATVKDSLSIHNGMLFGTWDRLPADRDCALRLRGGWWYLYFDKYCTVSSNLNGIYPHRGSNSRIHWANLNREAKNTNPRSTERKIRPVDFF